MKKKIKKKQVFIDAAKRITGYWSFACCTIDSVTGKSFGPERKFYCKMFSPDGDQDNPFAWWAEDMMEDRKEAERIAKQHRVISLLLA